MAATKPQQMEELQQPQRRIVPPISPGERFDPDTAEQPPETAIAAHVEKVVIPPAIGARTEPSVGGPAPLPVPDDNRDPLVVVKPMRTFSCVVGLTRYDFEKGKSVRVPASVRQVVGRGNNNIYP